MDVFDEGEDRAAVYKLFSRFFFEEPSDDIIMQLKETLSISSDETPQEVRSDYNGLFILQGLHLSPHESLYHYPIGDKPRLWGKSAYDVQALYTAAGIMLDETTDLIPDHISLELLFMSYLIESDLPVLRKRFMEEHLLQWVSEYCEELRKHARTTFCRELANALREFILSDAERV